MILREDYINDDPIVEFKSVYDGEWNYAIARRNSGKVDFYWNYLRMCRNQNSIINIENRFLQAYLDF